MLHIGVEISNAREPKNDQPRKKCFTLRSQTLAQPANILIQVGQYIGVFFYITQMWYFALEILGGLTCSVFKGLCERQVSMIM